MLKVLKNQDGFSGLIGVLIAIVVIGIMSAMILPTFTARMNYKQAQYVAGVTKTIENAENAYMAKNGSFADLVTLSQNGYLSPQFLQSLQPANNPGGPYPQANWITLELAKHTVNLCIDNNGGCPDNPSGNNYFIGLYSVPSNYANYIEHELPGSGIGSQGGGLEYVAYAAPVPSAPPLNVNINSYKYSEIYNIPGYYTFYPNPYPSNGQVIVTLVGGAGGNGGSSYFGVSPEYNSGAPGEEISNQVCDVQYQSIGVWVGQDGGNGDGETYPASGGGGWGYNGGQNGQFGSCSSGCGGESDWGYAGGGGGGGGGSSAVSCPNIFLQASGGGGGAGSYSPGHAAGGNGGNGGGPGPNYGGYWWSPGVGSDGKTVGQPGPSYGYVEFQWN